MATQRQKKAAEKLVGNGGNVTQAMRDAGYAEATTNTPGKLTKSKAWEELMDTYLPEKKVAQVHRELLDAKHLDYQTFPIDIKDDDIKALIASVGGTLRKIQHSERITHAWFWAPDARIRKDAAELAYKLRARLTQKVVVDPPDLSELLDNVEANNHAALARKAAEALGSAAGRQVVADDEPVQDPEQAGSTGDLPPELPPA